MITNPTTMLDMKLAKSATAKMCGDCCGQVQLRRTADGATVVLEVYPSDDGEYVITAELHAARTDGPFGYKRHVCQGE